LVQRTQFGSQFAPKNMSGYQGPASFCSRLSKGLSNPKA